MKVCFHSYQLGYRGSEVAMYQYAKYNEEILGNTSIICSTTSRPGYMEMLPKFKDRFEVFLYDDVWNQYDNMGLRTSLERIVQEQGVDVFYAIKGGENDGILPSNCRTMAHCIFRMDQPHGDAYFGVSSYAARKFGRTDYVPHMVELEGAATIDVRKQYGIPQDAMVIGRIGSPDCFSIPFVTDALIDMLENRKDLYFVMMNTELPFSHERLILVPFNMDVNFKYSYISSCDAMLHARRNGEMFGLAPAEFSYLNKAVITYDGNANLGSFYDRAHLDMLGDKCLTYADRAELEKVIGGLTKEFLASRNWDAFSKEYAPKPVMELFKRYLQ